MTSTPNPSRDHLPTTEELRDSSSALVWAFDVLSRMDPISAGILLAGVGWQIWKAERFKGGPAIGHRIQDIGLGTLLVSAPSIGEGLIGGIADMVEGLSGLTLLWRGITGEGYTNWLPPNPEPGLEPEKIPVKWPDFVPGTR